MAGNFLEIVISPKAEEVRQANEKLKEGQRLTFVLGLSNGGRETHHVMVTKLRKISNNLWDLEGWTETVEINGKKEPPFRTTNFRSQFRPEVDDPCCNWANLQYM